VCARTVKDTQTRSLVLTPYHAHTALLQPPLDHYCRTENIREHTELGTHLPGSWDNSACTPVVALTVFNFLTTSTILSPD